MDARDLLDLRLGFGNRLRWMRCANSLLDWRHIDSRGWVALDNLTVEDAQRLPQYSTFRLDCTSLYVQSPFLAMN